MWHGLRTSRCRSAFFGLDEGEQLIHLDRIDLAGHRRFWQPMSVSLDPIGHTLWIDPQLSPYSAQVGAIHVHPNRPHPRFVAVALRLGFRRVMTLAFLALIALRPAPIVACSDLILIASAVWTLDHFSSLIHLRSFRYSRDIDR